MRISLDNPDHVAALRLVCETWNTLTPRATAIEAELIRMALDAFAYADRTADLIEDACLRAGARFVTASINASGATLTIDYICGEAGQCVWSLDRAHGLVLALLDAKDEAGTLKALRSGSMTEGMDNG